MSSKKFRQPSAEAQQAICRAFDASERLYRAKLVELAQGRRVPRGEETPTALAFDVAMLAIKYNVQCPNWAAEVVSEAWARYMNFDCASVGEAFGIPNHKHCSAKRAELLSAAVYHAVREKQAEGIPQKDNGSIRGALSLVGDQFHMSGKKVEKLMANYRATCRELGMDPDAKLPLANAGSVVDEAWAKAWTSHGSEN